MSLIFHIDIGCRYIKKTCRAGAEDGISGSRAIAPLSLTLAAVESAQLVKTDAAIKYHKASSILPDSMSQANHA